MQFPISTPSRSIRRFMTALACGLLFTLLVPETLRPCGGTPRPPTCARTIWLGKSVPRTVAIDANGGATFEIVLLPFVGWSSACPAPNAATLTLDIRCVSLSTGDVRSLGPLRVPVNVPTSPGAQTLANGTNRLIQTIAAGQLDPNDRYVCTVVGSWSVTFPSTRQVPIPSPTITGGGDATMCLVPRSPSSGAAPVPELSIRQITPDNASFLRCRRGDQAVMHFLVENNRTDRSVTVDLESVGRQTARLPVGFASPQAAYDSLVTSISSPVGGTDVFPAAFTDQLSVGEILPDGDPMEVNPRRITRQLRLGPCEAHVVSIAVRSHGMCTDGSCNMRDVTLRGRWSNGDTAVACAGTMLLVDSRPAKTPLCEVTDDIAVSDSVETEFSPAQMVGPKGAIDHGTTHFAGNLSPRQQRRGTVLAGDSLAQLNPPYRSSAADYIRLPDSITGVTYQMVGRPLWFDFVPFGNNVTILNLSDGKAVELPFIFGNPGSQAYDVRYNAADDSIVVAVQGDPVYQGTLTGLIANPPRGWIIDEGTSRVFEKVENPAEEAWIWTDPSGIARLLRQIPGLVYGDEITVYEGVRQVESPWRAAVTGAGVTAPPAGNDRLPLNYNLAAITPFPATSINWVNVSLPAGTTPVLNQPLPVPVVLRKKELPAWVREIRVAQVDYEQPIAQPNSTSALFTVSYDPQPEPRFINVLMRTRSGRGEVWMIRNLLLAPFANGGQSIDVWFDLSLLGYEDGEDVGEIEIDIFFDVTPMLEEPPPTLWTPIELDDRINVTPDGVWGDDVVVEPQDSIRLPRFVRNDQLDWIYRGCEMPNIDLDSSRNNPRLRPGTTGDFNGCVPAAASNSLQWLESKHPKIDIPLSHRELMEELARKMNHVDSVGVFARNFVEGKLAIIDSLKLPIRVKFQGYWFDTNDIDSPDTTYGHRARNDNDSNRAPVTWQWLMQEMEDGEDVELTFGYYDSNNVRRGGHCITVTGMSDVRTARGIYYKDDGNQKDTGGTRQKYVNWDTSSTGWPYLVGISTDARRCWVEMAVSESYDSTITFPVAPTENIGIRRFDFAQPFRSLRSILGQVSWQTEPSTTTRFLNVYARLSPEDQPVWLVQNMILPPFPESEEIAYWVNFELLGVGAGERLDAIWLLPEVDDEVLVSFSPGTLSDLWEHHPVQSDLYVVANGHEQEIGGPMPISNFRYPLSPVYGSIVRPDSVYRGCTVPNIDLDSTRNRPDTGYAGDWNACGPASAANSLHWLEQTHDRLDSTSTLREKLRQLSRMMGRAPRGGVIDEQFIKGKLAFIDRHRLPIRVKFQTRWRDTADIPSPDTTGRNGNPERGGYGHEADNRNDSNRAEPTWNFLVQEMKAGEDVELVVQWTDSLGRNAGAHAVVVTGVNNANGSRRLWYKDDRRQDTAGGMQQAQVTWDTANGRPIIRELGMHDTLAYITVIYSESYDSTVRFDTIAGPGGSSVQQGETGEVGLDLTVVRNPSDRREPVEIAWRLRKRGQMSLEVYDLAGRLVRSLHDAPAEAGEGRLLWRGEDDRERLLPAGAYLIVLRQGERERVVRIVRY